MPLDFLSGLFPVRRSRVAAAAIVAASIAAGGGCALLVLLLVASEPALLLAGLLAARYALLVRLAFRLARLERAEEAVRRDPTSADLHIELAEARLAKGDFQGGIRAFRVGVGLSPSMSLSKPEDIVDSLLLRPGVGRRRKGALAELLVGALLVRFLEDHESATATAFPDERCGDESGKPGNAGDDERFRARPLDLSSSLRAEIAGMEEILSQLHLFVAGEEAERDRRYLGREIARLRARTRRLEDDGGPSEGERSE